MRILHVVTTIFRSGGVANHLLSLMRGQVEAGHEVAIVYLKGEGTLAPRFLAAGCRSVDKAAFDRFGQIVSCLAALCRRVRAGRYDIVHTHLMKANALAGIAARLAGSGVTVIASKHNDEHLLRYWTIGLLHGLISRLCDDHVICISDHVGRFIEKYGRVPAHRITRIYYGLDASLYGEPGPVDPRREFGLPADSFVFGVVARLTEQKNHLLLLAAFARLAREHPAAYLLVIGGEGHTPEYRLRVERRIAELGLAGRAIMTGWRQDAVRLMAGLDCMVLPSAWEGLGLVFIEAIAQGVPVIASRVSAIPEVVRDGIDGLLVAPGDEAALAAAMDRMIVCHADFRRRARDAGPPYVAEKFGRARMISETLALYRRICGERETA